MMYLRIPCMILAAFAIALPADAQQQPLGTQQPLGKQQPLGHGQPGVVGGQIGTSQSQRLSQGGSSTPAMQPVGAAKLRVTNSLAQPVDSYRFDDTAQQMVSVATIAPGASQEYDVRQNQVWVFGVNQSEVQRYVASAAPQQTVTIGSASQVQQPGQSGQPAMANSGPVIAPVIVTQPTPLNPRQGDRGSFPPAKSWGGIVRSGPGLEYDKLGSVAERTPIEILARTGDIMNGYPWFQIRFGDGVGYQWGGIICGVNQPIDGAYEVCN